MNELLGSHAAHCDAALEGEQVDFYSAFEETSAEIERWATGDVSFQPPDKYVPEETFICYGMVSITYLTILDAPLNSVYLSALAHADQLSPTIG